MASDRPEEARPHLTTARNLGLKSANLSLNLAMAFLKTGAPEPAHDLLVDDN